MLNVAPQKERISDHLRAMAEQDDKSAASDKTGEQSTIGVGCAPGEERRGSPRPQALLCTIGYKARGSKRAMNSIFR